MVGFLQRDSEFGDAGHAQFSEPQFQPRAQPLSPSPPQPQPQFQSHGAAPKQDLWGNVTCGPSCQSSELSYGFLDPQFSDCVLRLLCTRRTDTQGHSPCSEEAPRVSDTSDTVEEEENSDSQTDDSSDSDSDTWPEETLELRVPVSALLLGAKSPAFRSMLSSGLKDASGKKQADISLTESEASVFIELVHFAYHGTVSSPLPQDLDAILSLLVLSHRFTVSALTAFCTQAASDLISSPSTFRPQQALQILSLPSPLHSLPSLLPLLASARALIRRTYAPLIKNGDLRGPLCELPEVGMTVLLESNTLAVESEDAVLAAALAWAEALSHGAQGHLDLLARVVLPRVRAPFLSPRAVLQLSHTVLGLLRDEPGVYPDHTAAARSEPSSLLEAPLEAWAASGVPSPSAAGLSVQSTTALVSCTHLAHCVELMREDGVLVPASALEWLRPGAPQLAPRLGYRPPDASLQLHISQDVCLKMHPRARPKRGVDIQLFDYTFAHGRRLEFLAFLRRGEERPEDWILGALVTFLAPPLTSEPRGQQRLRVRMAVGSGANLRPCFTRSIAFTSWNDNWGCADVLNTPWSQVLEQTEVFFPQGVLELKADVWFEDKDPCELL